MPAFALGLLATLSATVSWGVQLPLARDAFIAVDPFHMTAIRYLVAAAFLAPVLAWREGRNALGYDGAGLKVCALGVIGMCGSPMLTFLGMSMSHAEHAVVIVTLQPAIAALALWALRGRRPPGFTLACIVVAFIGVVLVVTRGRIDFMESPRQVMGDLIVLLGAGCWVIYTMGTGRLAGWSVWRITVLTMIPGAVATTLLTALLVSQDTLTLPSVAAVASVGWEIAFLTFVGVIYGMLAWNYGARRIGVMNATLLINCMPVSTFAYRAFQGREFALVELAGALLVVLALMANNLYLRAVHRGAVAAQRALKPDQARP